MRALLLERFGVEPRVAEVREPVAPAGGVVVAVGAAGLCRSDWHAYAGHDADVRLPQVLGHEFAGTVVSAGDGAPVGLVGRRVTAPFVQACGSCAECRQGDHQVCRHQQQPGFTRPGAFAQHVVVEHAAVNLVPLPDDVGLTAAAVLGCRFATSFRALAAVGRMRPGEWVAVHGCGGVGLSAVMIAVAGGARVVAVDVSAAALGLARELGAEAVVDAARFDGWADVGTGVRDVTGGGAHLSVDALGSAGTCSAALAGLRRRGRHVQIGLLPPAGGLPAVPLHLLIAGELELLGSHGMAAHAYPELLALVASGRLRPDRLVTRTIPLAEAGAALAAMDVAPPAGVTVVVP